MFNNEKSSEYIIGNSFKELMSINQYDKITIKMIAEKSNIPRSTFYNYFEDKLDLLEWLLYENLFNSIIDLIDTGMELEALKMLFLKIEKDKAFYTNAFKIEGQDSFEMLLKLKDKIPLKIYLKIYFHIYCFKLLKQLIQI